MNTETKTPEQKEKEKIFEILKFTPCTYKVRLWGYGGELVMGQIDKKVWDYFRDNRIDLGDYACDSDFGESLNIPEDCQPFYPGQWHDCDDMYHGWGVSRNSGTLQVEDENGNVVYERSIDDLDGTDVELSSGDEAWIEMRGKDTYVFYNYSSEKGTFFEADLELTAPFDPEKLALSCDDVDADELVTSVSYNGETLDNYGGDTNGKGYDFKFYHVKEDNSVEYYADGNDVDENFDDGTPPMGPSPSDWEKSKKITEGNPTITGWYSCHYLSGTWSSLYWNNDRGLWEDYYHGRVVAEYKEVNWYQGYNWDTSDWNNQPTEPPNIICKKCKHVAHSADLGRDDDYNYICPECSSTKTDWIDYDPESKKGLANRKKYMQGA